MIEFLGTHCMPPEDIVPVLMTTHTIANPEYDPVEARRREQECLCHSHDRPDDEDDAGVTAAA